MSYVPDPTNASEPLDTRKTKTAPAEFRALKARVNAIAASLGTVTSVGLTAPAAGITVSGGPVTTTGTFTLGLANDLAALEALSSTGFAVRTAADTWILKSAVSLSADVTGNLPVANLAGGAGASASTFWRGDGVWAGVPAGGTVTSVQISGPSAGITVSGGPITSNGTISLTLNGDLLAVENLSTTGVVKRTGASTWATGTIDLGSEVSGNLPVSRLNSGLNASGTTFWRGDGIWAQVPVSSGTVTSVAIASADPNIAVSGGPITSSGTLNVGLQGQLATITSLAGTGFLRRASAGGAWTLDSAISLVSQVSGNLPVSNLNSGSGATGSTFWRGDGTWATPDDTTKAALNSGPVFTGQVRGNGGTKGFGAITTTTTVGTPSGGAAGDIVFVY